MNVEELRKRLAKALEEYAIVSAVVSELRMQLILREWTRKVHGK
mgnify:CR=1 FL=1